MELLYKNIVNTTTQINPGNNTLTAEYLLSRNLTKQYVTDGYSANTASSIVFTFDITQTVSKIVLMGMNYKTFRIFYNGATASTFTITNGATTTTNFSTNSETSMFMTVNTTAVSSITIDVTDTIVAGTERALSYVVFSDLLLNFERVPSSKNYKPQLKATDVEHVLSDGGTRINYIDNKWSTTIKWKNISTAFRDDLKEVYDLKDEFIFAAFPTMTGWDEVLYPCVWSGDFKFYEYADDFVQAGFSGDVIFKEVPT